MTKTELKLPSVKDFDLAVEQVRQLHSIGDMEAPCPCPTCKPLGEAMFLSAVRGESDMMAMALRASARRIVGGEHEEARQAATSILKLGIEIGLRAAEIRASRERREKREERD